MSGTEMLGVPIGPMGFGLMGFTWRPKITPDDRAFSVMKRAIELGAKFFNSGEFYGSIEPTMNLDLVNRFFTKYPEYSEKVVLSVKGGADLKTLTPDGRPEAVRASVNNILKHLGGAKKLDIFECARVDKKVPIEITIGALKEMVNEGLIGGISLSEVGVESIKRAAKVHPIAAVEIEYSLWSLEAYELGVLQTCAELGIPVVAYSPLGMGFLTGQIRSRADIDQGDSRLHFDRFSEENFALNLQLVDEVGELAGKKNITPPQLALSWVKKHEEVIPGLTIIPIPGATTLDRIEENYTTVPPLTDEEFAEIGEILKKFEVRGGRYNAHAAAHLWG
ncbi:NADP-dependent oxidoreductase domain-containing protein [Lipomyces mesembrius]